ncbi:hypothetical protein [Paenibacillus sp. GYB003]|uniref:hypothetical protein n=1 Tax=Paenibacillus sp. GYB003 TaxID=2994392 RepID=UPI002F96AE9D
MAQQADSNERWELLFPIDGDMLHDRDGDVRDGRLYIRVLVAAPDGSRPRVNGVAAERRGETYAAEIALDAGRNAIEIADAASGRRESRTVYWLRNAANKYRLSVDDNIWWLRDIAANAQSYRSIFDNPYLGMYKRIHDTYGTKVHFNIYYRTDGFDLSQMPDTFKDEWKANAHWMRLTFHALQNDPDKPYIQASAEQIMRDCELVTNEIVRFAGEELLDRTTTIHWGEATLEGCRALRRYGFRALAGYFRFADGKPIVSYYLDEKRTAHLEKRDFWKDNGEDIAFVKIDAVLDKLRLDEVVPALERLKEAPNESGFVELLIHEQYFYPHYGAYQPDYRDKIEAAVKWAADNGYEPAFLSELGLFE